MTKEMRKSSFWRYFPLFLGWILALLSIEAATASSAFLFPLSSWGPFGIYFLRIAFLLGVSFGILLFSKIASFPGWTIAVGSLVAFLLSLLPLSQPFIYATRLVFALLSGMIAGRFGIDFFLAFTNQEKGISLAFALLFSPLAYLPLDEEIVSVCLLALLSFVFFFH